MVDANQPQLHMLPVTLEKCERCNCGSKVVVTHSSTKETWILWHVCIPSQSERNYAWCDALNPELMKLLLQKIGEASMSCRYASEFRKLYGPLYIVSYTIFLIHMFIECLIQTYVNTFSPFFWFCRFDNFAFLFSFIGRDHWLVMCFISMRLSRRWMWEPPTHSLMINSTTQLMNKESLER